MTLCSLNNWAVVTEQTTHGAPECARHVLIGTVHDHPMLQDGAAVTTSRIVAAVGRLVQTRSGTAYVLGAPSAEYLQWLRDNKLTYDVFEPIKFEGK